jgi:Skp family chaperone for outer membrane proteins
MVAFSSTTSATLVIFASLGLVALAMGLLARRYSATALTIGLAGLLALTTASTWIAYAKPENAVPVINTLKSEIARLNKELHGAREPIQELEKRIEALQRKNNDIQKELSTAQAEKARARQDADKANGKIEGLTKELTATRAKVAELEKQRPPPKVAPIDPGIRGKLDGRVVTPFYTAEPLQQRALVAGRTGRWYVMRLKLDDKPFVFADRQFRMPETMQQIKESVLHLRTDILAPVGQVAKSTRLFLRGGADARPVAGATEIPDTREVEVLPSLPDGTTYASSPKHLSLPLPVRNDDLPSLRADWLRQHIRPILGSADIELLENRPAPGQERTVDLILYVDW